MFAQALGALAQTTDIEFEQYGIQAERLVELRASFTTWQAELRG